MNDLESHSGDDGAPAAVPVPAAPPGPVPIVAVPKTASDDPTIHTVEVALEQYKVAQKKFKETETKLEEISTAMVKAMVEKVIAANDLEAKRRAFEALSAGGSGSDNGPLGGSSPFRAAAATARH